MIFPGFRPCVVFVGTVQNKPTTGLNGAVLASAPPEKPTNVQIRPIQRAKDRKESFSGFDAARPRK
ncbi:hypothetical protein GEV33_005208 [Tenebrio molitor]|uniref:Uncharacterized protein n=1 Tax=Tenebrio molitor TaxID=7067 RepID=A0A8J6LF24_TENMO|nr:hypothetical protein GEV33_005208 [Tenebrio molitor]